MAYAVSATLRMPPDQVADHGLVLVRRAALPLVLEAGELRLEVFALPVQGVAGGVPAVGGGAAVFGSPANSMV